MSTRIRKRPKVPRSELSADGPLYVTRDEALAALAVKANTLYTYVSRGLIRSLATDGSRQRLFSRIDVEELVIRSKAHEGAAARAQSAMRFGEPIINTSITNVTPNGPVYRGYNAIDLVRAGVSFESVAHLLWEGALVERPQWPANVPCISPALVAETLRLALPPKDVLKLFSFVVLALGLSSVAHSDDGPESVIASAQQIIQTLAWSSGLLAQPCIARDAAFESTVAMTFARALNIRATDAAISLINAALILCADLELTTGTFAARVAASAESDVYACISAGISAHGGSRSKMGFESCEDFLMGHERTIEQKLDLARSQGQHLPGFYYRIFPEGDPRARALIDLVKETIPMTEEAHDMLILVERVDAECGISVGIAAALVVMTTALGLPRRSATALWALSRVAGQTAHIIEQRNEGFLIRPRARYEGER